MAFHANQGPRMGLPQMIQSRAQFGTRGAVVPFIAVLFVYVGFNVFNVILATQSLQLVLPGGAGFWYPTLILIAVALAVVGYDLLHLVQRWLTYLMIAVFALLTYGALSSLDAGSAVPDGGFSWSSFLITFGAAAGYQISYAVYVSDYSRYLPRDVPAPGVISWTYAGAAASAVWLMSLGSLLASSIPAPDAVGSIQQVGNSAVRGVRNLRRGHLRPRAGEHHGDQLLWRDAHRSQRRRRLPTGEAQRAQPRRRNLPSWRSWPTSSRWSSLRTTSTASTTSC